MRRSVLLLLALLALAVITLPAAAGPLPEPPPPGPTPIPPEEDARRQVEASIQETIRLNQEFILDLLIYDVQAVEIRVSQDLTWAASWLALVDRETGEILPTEPGLAFSRRTDSVWTTFLPADPAWIDLLKSAPPDILSDSERAAWLEMYGDQQLDLLAAPLGGYLLPWAAGETRYLSQSVAHDRYTSGGSAHYSFDFYNGTMFRIYAAKAGLVALARWDVANGNDRDMGNYILVQDPTTNPVTYVLYLHLAKESIPPGLRQIGATVVQGQFLGLADDTGQSTGHHLHFHVHKRANWYWGDSVDITFNDVSINGGRPRATVDRPYCWSTDVCNTFQSAYVSANVPAGDITPPTGGLTKPATGDTIRRSLLRIEAWASDVGSGLDGAQLIAYYNGEWQDVGVEQRSSQFTVDWDMCAAGVPDGPVSLALRVWDREGNPAFGLPGLTHITKNYDCSPPPPACTPAADQVALFSKLDYGGNCVRFGVGSYPDSASLGALGDDNAAAVKVGSQVLATLYTDASYAGRGETFASADASLADNLVGSDTLSSLKVRLRSNKPVTPSSLVAPLDGTVFSAGSTVSLVWRDAGGGTQFQAQMDGPLGIQTSGWLGAPFWRLDGFSLVPGTYTWKARARNCATSTCNSGWSSPVSFSVVAGGAPPTSVSAPWQDNVEGGTNGWTASGLWNRLNDAQRSHSTSFSWYYGDPAGRVYKDGTPNSGDLTSRPISISQAGYALRFWYRYQTEGPGRYWDQRWVQISSNGGPYTNVLKLQDDAPNYWLNAAIDLSAYAGKTIRVRFYFATLDGAFNAYEGWYVDDISIGGPALPGCSDNDNSPSKAIAIQYGESADNTTCPQGDVDFYKFSGAAGDRVVVDVDTPTSGAPSDHDLIVFLLDADGRSPLASHDDELPGERLDPHLGYTLWRSGTYYIKVRQWSHPSSGGTNYSYTLRLSKDGQPPSAQFTEPVSGDFISGNLSLQLAAQDNGSGVGHVKFLYHSGDWLTGAWETLGEDWDGSDGWGMNFAADGLAEQTGLAFYAQVYDWAGGWAGAGAWNLGIDRTAPTSALQPLSSSQNSTAVNLQWTGGDSVSGVGHYDLQSRAGSGAWTDVSPDPGGRATQAWFVGGPGLSYGFRMRAVDQAGNQEALPASAETTTAIPSAATLCAAKDTWEASAGDNTYANATPITPGGQSATHNFCKSQAAGWLNDEDWVRFSVKPGQIYVLRGVPLASSAATILELYAADGVTRIARAAAPAFGEQAQIRWTSDRSGRVYLRVRHLDGRVIGSAVQYRLVVQTEHKQFLPAVGK